MDDGKKNAMNPLLVLHEQRNETVSSSLYVVQKGDTLVSIARKFRMSVKEIQEKMVATRVDLSKSTIICKVKRASLTLALFTKNKDTYKSRNS